MALDQDIIDLLARQTGDGAVEWKATDWDENGHPTKWRGKSQYGQSFSLRSGRPQLQVYYQERWVTVGADSDVAKLFDAVEKKSGVEGRTRKQSSRAYWTL